MLLNFVLVICWSLCWLYAPQVRARSWLQWKQNWQESPWCAFFLSSLVVAVVKTNTTLFVKTGFVLQPSTINQKKKAKKFRPPRHTLLDNREQNLMLRKKKWSHLLRILTLVVREKASLSLFSPSGTRKWDVWFCLLTTGSDRESFDSGMCTQSDYMARPFRLFN